MFATLDVLVIQEVERKQTTCKILCFANSTLRESAGDSFMVYQHFWSVCCVAVQSLMPASVVCALSGRKSKLKQRLASLSRKSNTAP